MNPLHTSIKIKRGLLCLIPTYCVNCKQKISFMETDYKGTFTKKCGCGCEVYKLHEPDDNNLDFYYTKNFVSAKVFRKDFKNKDAFEQCGFTKNGDGKYVK